MDEINQSAMKLSRTEQKKRKEQNKTKQNKPKFVKLKAKLFYFYFSLLCVTAINRLYPAFILLSCFVFLLHYFHNCLFAVGLQLEHS